jgi:hypothetical protein
MQFLLVVCLLEMDLRVCCNVTVNCISLRSCRTENMANATYRGYNYPHQAREAFENALNAACCMLSSCTLALYHGHGRRARGSACTALRVTSTCLQRSFLGRHTFGAHTTLHCRLDRRMLASWYGLVSATFLYSIRPSCAAIFLIGAGWYGVSRNSGCPSGVRRMFAPFCVFRVLSCSQRIIAAIFWGDDAG